MYTRDEHEVSRKQISPNALKVLYRLKDAGFQAFLVGGGVRDILLGIEPKDFDVATDAHPDEIRRLFGNCRLIGRRFRLAHVRFGREIIEVATFRAAHDGNEDGASIAESGRIVRDNVYGSLDDDVWRRDFTVNALYYNIADFSIVDYVGGVEDIRLRRLRLIGDPDVRYREDPVRMLRAIRFATKLGLTIDDATRAAFSAYAGLLDGIAPARLFDETLKMLHSGSGLAMFDALRTYGLFEHLFPASERAFNEDETALALVRESLKSTDERIAADKPVTPAFIFAALLWQPFRRAETANRSDGLAPNEAFAAAADATLAAQVRRVAIPRRFTSVAREIWSFQGRLERRSPKTARKLIDHPRFRAAYDFLVLRAAAGDADAETAQWWTEIQQVDDTRREELLVELRAERPRRSRPRTRRRKRADHNA